MNIVVKLNKGQKLNVDNFKIWSMMIQYVLEEQEVLETLKNVMVEPEAGNTAQHKRDKESYDAWSRKNKIARITLLSNMENDIMRIFRGIWHSQRHMVEAGEAVWGGLRSPSSVL